MGKITKTKWILNQEAFEKLLFALDQEREKSAEKYLDLRKNLVRFFEYRGIYDSEEATDEVINRLAKKLENNENIEQISTFALGVARMLTLEIKKRPELKPLDEIPQQQFSSFETESDEKEKKYECLDICLQEISPQNREIIIIYYQGEKREKINNRQSLAEKLDIPQNALRSRAVRLRKKLEDCILNCLKN